MTSLKGNRNKNYRFICNIKKKYWLNDFEKDLGFTQNGHF